MYPWYFIEFLSTKYLVTEMIVPMKLAQEVIWHVLAVQNPTLGG